MKICTVIVTYANRFHLLKQVVEAALMQGVNKVIIVDNNSHSESKEKLRNYELKNLNRIKVIYLEDNTGSAGGYKRGIEEAYKDPECDFIWLLDDDNKPLNEALDKLRENYLQLEQSNDRSKLALLSLREDRLNYVKSAIMGDSTPYFPVKNSVLGFHIKQFPFKISKKVVHRFKEEVPLKENYVNFPVIIPYAPYGGLFFHKSIIDNILFPDENFYLYSDDHEYTYRITKNNGNIFLIPYSKLKDIDTSWHIKEKYNLFKTLLFSESSFRVYYTIRNRIYFEMKDLVKNKVIYLINLSLFQLILKMLSIYYKKNERFNLIKKAIHDAKQGELGRNENFNF
ncbi:glycosyltransferase [Tepidibacillus sp. LV47]|uniref:glycosyltransferase n=1 Tax=Tepidibacillus sp. LV47 TaxID=3398228 RepID=UPI003AAC01FC